MLKIRNKNIIIWILFLIWISCRSGSEQVPSNPAKPVVSRIEDTKAATTPVELHKIDYDSSIWVDIEVLIPDIQLEIKYATSDNFTKKQIYDCPRCLLRKDAAQALLEAYQLATADGYGMKVFDCYRPAPYQQRLWDVVPDDRYVANPKKGSMHSRGAAIDLTLIDPATLQEVDMGTPYDYFGREAHPAYRKLDQQILDNRERLAMYMSKAGFKPITSEWWHFDYGSRSAPLADFVWSCE